MKILTIIFTLAVILSGCDTGPTSGKGFTLPEGDLNSGKATFISLNCNRCHSVDGQPDILHSADAEITVVLGGKVRMIETYGKLVTSIINPSHKLAKGYDAAMIQEGNISKMTNYNSVMTVQQLADLVTFLQPQYELEPITHTRYPPFRTY